MLCVIPEGRSNDAWIAATWKQEWEASGPVRVHRHVSEPVSRFQRVCGFACVIRSGYLVLANQQTPSEGQGSRDLRQTRVEPY